MFLDLGIYSDDILWSQGSLRLNILLDQSCRDQTEESSEPPIDWKTVLASELICGVTVALGICFDVTRLSRSDSERNSMAMAGQKLTEVRCGVLLSHAILGIMGREKILYFWLSVNQQTCEK